MLSHSYYSVCAEMTNEGQGNKVNKENYDLLGLIRGVISDVLGIISLGVKPLSKYQKSWIPNFLGPIYDVIKSLNCNIF